MTTTQPELPGINWTACKRASQPRHRTSSRRPAPAPDSVSSSAEPVHRPPARPRRRSAVAPPNWGDLHGQRADAHALHRMTTVQLTGSYL